MREDLTKQRFIEETYRIISTEGVEALSIRRLAADMKCNSASIYYYFKNLDELVEYASLRYLTSYLADVAACYDASENTYQTHIMVWDCFSRHSFANARLFDNLFFGSYSENLGEIIQSYYEMFPHDMQDVPLALRDVFRSGSFDRRDYLMISRCVEDGWFTQEDAKFLNTLSIHLFMGYLKDLLGHDSTPDTRQAIQKRFMECLKKVFEAYKLK